MKKYLLLLLLGLLAFASFNPAEAQCNWKSRGIGTNFWDSCNVGSNSLNAYIAFKTSASCFNYLWTVNGVSVNSNSNIFKYKITQNDTYNICVKVIDTCNFCDTTICSQRIITCISNSNCNWKNRKYGVNFWDSCKVGANSLNAVIAFKTSTSCFKYTWTVNGVTTNTTTNTFKYNITKNDTYSVCVRVTDTCNNCDTIFCSQRIITCISSGNTGCNWKSRYPTPKFWDSCTATSKTINGYIPFNYGTSCFKYQWTVNGNNVGSNKNNIYYPVTQNGNYNLCVKVTDTCNNCDTVFCSSRSVTCFSNGNTCNWKSRGVGTSFWDSCKVGANSLNAYIAFKTSTSCFKYKWTVNGVITSNTSNIFKYNITKNDTYSVCVKVTDTCNNCDTIFCSQRIITCISSGNTGCNWKSRYPTPKFWDSCTATSKTINGYIPFNYGTSCFKYQWTVNGNNVGSNLNNIYYPITQNGNYNICVKVTDTCNNCDTVFCSSRSVTCFSNGNTCNWKNRKTSASFWDSCTSTSKSINGIVTIDASYASCCIYQWAVNGVKVGNNSQYINYPVTQNGSYNICLKVIDTCNNCDTIFCSARYINCFSNNNPCNWQSKKPGVTFWDSCKVGANSLNAYIAFNSNTSCLIYKWTVNGVPTNINSNIFKYNITKNDTYSVCVKVTDTCNNCDTIFCSQRVITCITNNTSCNWSSRYPNSKFWDSCTSTSKTINGYVSFNSPTAKCFKYQYTINGIKVGNGAQYIYYPVTQNGSYNICVKVTDTCNNCDTVFCSTINITCFSGGNTGCNWSNRQMNNMIWDSCNATKKTVNAYISFNSGSSCLRYEWKVNNNFAGKGMAIYYPITQNGTYDICVKVTDTCKLCDTIYCFTKTINCFNGINNNINESNIDIYPNPANEAITIDWTLENSNYYIVNISGQQVLTGKLNQGKQSIDLSKYPEGVYFIRIQTSQDIITKKIVIQKN